VEASRNGRRPAMLSSNSEFVTIIEDKISQTRRHKRYFKILTVISNGLL